MKNPFQSVRCLLKTQVVLFVCICYFGCPTFSYAQDQAVKPLPVALSDTLTFSKEQKALFNALTQALKFRENRNAKEKERTYKLILKLINDRDLSRPSNRNAILKMIETLNNADATKLRGLDQKISSTNEAVDSLRTSVIDSFEVAFSKGVDSVFKKRMEEYVTDQSKIDPVNDTALHTFKDIDCSCAWLNEQSDNDKKSRGACLEPKVKVMGWHNKWNKLKYENYDFRYVSALNLYGYYELGSDGKSKTDENLEELNAGRILDFSRGKNTNIDLFLTVHNSNSNEITSFLRNSQAQKYLIDKLNELYLKNEINGVNLYFEEIKKMDAHHFNNFISKIYTTFKSIEDFNILITIPSIYDDSSLEDAKVYDFPELNPKVDYFILLTDRMTRYDSDWAQPQSPLHSKSKPEFGTINSTVAFYSNNLIPRNKLIVSVSYLGQKWQVLKGFSGQVKEGSKPIDIEYSDILRGYKNNKKFSKNLEQGYDSIQKAAYLNITDSTSYLEPQYYKIWYENQESLMSKYQWILENNLGGVSIRGLGYDDGYSELWDALGSTLIEMRSIKTEIEDSKSDQTNYYYYVVLPVAVLILLSVFFLYRKHSTS